MIPGEGHLLEPPYSPLSTFDLPGGPQKLMEKVNKWYMPASNVGVFWCGGEYDNHEQNQELAWKTLLDFLANNLDTSPTASRKVAKL